MTKTPLLADGFEALEIIIASVRVAGLELMRESVNSTDRLCSMSGNTAHYTARLEILLSQIDKEPEPVRNAELCSELWLILNEHERLTAAERTGDANETVA